MRLTTRLVISACFFAAYGVYWLVATAVHALGGPVLPTVHSHHQDAAEQRAIHDDFDRLEGVDACMASGGRLSDAIDAANAAMERGDPPRLGLPSSPSCASVGTHAGRSPWTEVTAAGRRVDAATQSVLAAARELARVYALRSDDWPEALAAFDAASTELHAALLGLRDGTDPHADDVLRRIENVVAADPARAAAVPAVHLARALIVVDHALRRGGRDSAELEDVSRRLDTAIAELPEAALRARARELVTAIRALGAAADEPAHRQAYDVAFEIGNQVLHMTNAQIPAV